MSSSLEASSLFRVDGIVAAITGGGTGIGLMMAQGLLANGASKVYILGRRLDVLQSAVESSPDGQGRLIPLQCDVTSKASLQEAVNAIATQTGYVNLLVANSGTGGSAMQWRDDAKSVADLRKALFDDQSMEDFTRALHVNVTGAFFTIAAFLELLDEGNKNALLKGGYGKPLREGSDVLSIQSQVIVTSSISAFIRGGAAPISYAGSKAAILHLAKQAASHLAKHGIRVNVLAPGLFPTELAAPLIRQRKPETEGPDHHMFIPTRRFGDDEDMAGTLLFLASRAGSYIDGLVLVNDGGRLGVMCTSY